MILFRPVGVKELELIAQNGYSAFPSRLPNQPIFYPVLNFAYAEQIARDWNTKDRASGFAGFVTKFEVDDAFISRYAIKTVGARQHQELWIPAEYLVEFNRQLIGCIEVVACYLGEGFQPEAWLTEIIQNMHRDQTM